MFDTLDTAASHQRRRDERERKLAQMDEAAASASSLSVSSARDLANNASGSPPGSDHGGTTPAGSLRNLMSARELSAGAAGSGGDANNPMAVKLANSGITIDYFNPDSDMNSWNEQQSGRGRRGRGGSGGGLSHVCAAFEQHCLPNTRKKAVLWVSALAVLGIVVGLSVAKTGQPPSDAAGGGIGVATAGTAERDQPPILGPNPHEGTGQPVPAPMPPGSGNTADGGESSATTTTSRSSSSEDDEAPAADGGTTAATPALTPQERFDLIQSRIVDSGLTDPTTLTHDPSSNLPRPPQLQAIEWLALHDGRRVDPDDDYLLERYALAVLWLTTKAPADLEDYNNPPDPTQPNAPNAHNWIRHDNWMTKAGICNWFGVQCHHRGVDPTETRYDGDGMVTHLNLTKNYVRGYVPDELWEGLVDLRVLDLSDNQINGTVPHSIGKWEDLEMVYLNQNGFSGTIPGTLFSPVHESKLTVLDLGGNYFESTISPTVGRLTNLKRLALYENWLTGTIPPTISELTRLQVLYLDTNDFSGNIPAELSRLGMLTDLRLRDNNFEGTIPSQLGDLESLETMYLDTNVLVGVIPTTLGKLERLEELHLYKNKLSGSLPSELGNLRYLDLMYLDTCEFTGSIPPSFGGLHDLKELFLYGNRLTGSIPHTMYGIEDIEELRLNNNELSGGLPPEIGQLLHLKHFHIEHNNFQGPLPSEMSNMEELVHLRVQANNLVGPVPDGICLLREKSLTDFSADCDDVQCKCCTKCSSEGAGGQTQAAPPNEPSADKNPPGEGNPPEQPPNEPGTPGDASTLNNARLGRIRQRIIDAGFSTDEQLTSPHPDASPQWQALNWIADQDERKLDPDDDNIFSRYALAVFFYSTYEATKREDELNPPMDSDAPLSNWLKKDNWLTGAGTCTWYGITCRQEMDLTPKSAGNGNPIVQINLTANSIRGEIPNEFWKVMTSVELLDFSDNMLNGTVPEDIGGWVDLKVLYLNQNFFVGSIPTSLFNPDHESKLEILDLGRNWFEKTIPEVQIGHMQNLARLAIYENWLTGTIPSSLSNCRMLDTLYLDSNDLTGEIPSELSLLGQLTDLRLRSNHLRGTIPPDLGNLQQLQIMYLDTNELTGPIPSEFGNLIRLEELHLYKNKLSGNLPIELGSLGYLSLLYLDSNEIEGPIPDSFGGLHDLKQLFLFSNKLTNSIPHTMFGIENVEELRLNDNFISGTLPPEIGQLLRLKNLHLENNNIQGFLPEEMGQMEDLEVLRIQNNGIIGEVPSGICSLRDITLNEFVSDCEALNCQCCTDCS